MGIGPQWGLGIGDWAQSPIPNPQSPIPNINNIQIILILIIKYKNKILKINDIYIFFINNSNIFYQF